MQTASWEQHRKEKRISKKAEEVANTLREEEFKSERLSNAQQQLEDLTQPQNPTEEGEPPLPSLRQMQRDRCRYKANAVA